MQLTDEQKTKLQEWAAEGVSLGEIQKRLEQTFGLAMTYMEVRFLISDLGLSLQDKERQAEKPAAVGEEAGAMPGKGLGAPGKAGKVSVKMDTIARPNAVASGQAVFSDGETADWSVGPMGLELNPHTAGYRPSQEDIMAFQVELQKVVRRSGL